MLGFVIDGVAYLPFDIECRIAAKLRLKRAVVEADLRLDAVPRREEAAEERLPTFAD